MNHDTIIKGLNKLSKTLPTDIDPKQHVRHIASENDRGSMILHGSTIDDMLAMYLKGNFKGLNSDEKARVFEYAGAAGTFSSRLFLAQAVGIITRVTRKRCEVIKAIRNTAAHSHEQISFSTPEIQNAVTHFSH